VSLFEFIAGMISVMLALSVAQLLLGQAAGPAPRASPHDRVPWELTPVPV
jgi:hypothetical protein